MVTQNLQMDFFNYAGIHRPVKLYTVPSDIHLDEMAITTSLNGDQTSATLKYNLMV